MYYEVLTKEIKYTGEEGVRKRATTGAIIYLESRKESKRMLKAKEIKQIPDEEVAIDRDFVLKHGEEPKKKRTISKEESEDGESEDGKRTPEVGDLVEALIDGRKLIGEVITVFKSKKLKIAFSADSKKHRQMKAADVEVIG